MGVERKIEVGLEILWLRQKLGMKRKSKSTYLNDAMTGDMTRKLQHYFRQEVKMPRIKRGEKQELETLINEEAMLLAKYLRNERESWIPRAAIPCAGKSYS